MALSFLTPDPAAATSLPQSQPPQTAARTTRRTTRRRRTLLTPLGWGPSGDVRGPFRTIPRVDEGSWEVGRNEQGQYFIRPRTEFTGLDPAYKTLFAAFDRQTQAQKGQIGQSYESAVKGAGADADALTTRLGSLAALSGGAAATQSAQAPATDTGAIAGDILATGGRQAGRQAAFDVNIASLLPTALRGAGQSAQSAYVGARDDAKAKALFDAHAAQTAAEAAAAQLEATVSGKQTDAEIKRQGLLNDLKIAGQRANAQVEAARIAAAARRYAADKGAQAGAAGGAAGGNAQGLGAASNAAYSLWNDTQPKFDPMTSEPIPNSVVPGLASKWKQRPVVGVGVLFQNMMGRGLTAAQAAQIVKATVGGALFNKWKSISGKKYGL